jgi:hypothetical protein
MNDNNKAFSNSVAIGASIGCIIIIVVVFFTARKIMSSEVENKAYEKGITIALDTTRKAYPVYRSRNGDVIYRDSKHHWTFMWVEDKDGKIKCLTINH